MGGGKTHLLVGFGLLAKSPKLRKTYCGGTIYASAFDTAAIAAFNGRNNPDHFFWGEIANQLGKGDQFKTFWTGGPKAPDEKDWLRLFEGDKPVLILLDEMPPYFHYLDTQKVGNGTVADIATRAFANLLTAAGKKKNVCVVVSDLAAAYDTGAKLIYRALEDARSELGRQERNITPVDLAANEIYDILRKRLFKSIPDKAEIEDIAEAFGRKLEEASKSKTANRGAESIADEIAATYPFHPRLKNVIALFKENEQFKQTDPRSDRVGVPPAQVGLGAAGQRCLSHRSAALRSLGPRGPRQAHRDLRDARRHRQGSMGCAAIGPRPDHRPPDRQGGRHPAWLTGPDGQPLDCRQCGEGPHARGDGRVPDLATA
jgi:hypothetical protein